MKLRDTTGVLRTVTSMKVRDGGGVLRTVTSVKARDSGGVLRTISGGSGGSSGAQLSPLLLQGYVYSAGSPRATTNAAYITMSVGTSPYTVVWHPDTDWSAVNPTSLTTAFRSPPLFSGDLVSGQVYAVVTDANGATYTTNTINMTAANNYNGSA